MRIFVTGATGLVGSLLLRRLCAAGDEVIALSRRPPDAPSRQVTWLTGNPTRAGDWQRHIDGVDAVVHLAGENIATRRWSAAQRDRLRTSRLESTRLLVAAMEVAARRPAVFVCSSATGYYGARGEETLDETSAPGRGFLADLCVAWEATARRAPARTVCLRFAVVLSRRGGALPRMLPAFKLMVGGPLGRAGSWFPWLAEDDAVGLILHALASPVAGPMNAVAPGLVRMREFAHTLGRVLHRPAFFPVPEPLLRLVLGEMGASITPGQRVIPAVATDSGYRFAHQSLESALAALLGPCTTEGS